MNKRDISFILENIDIVEVIEDFNQIRKKGKNYSILCKVHQDTNPSVVISREKQIFKCFSCNVGGTAIDYLIKFEKFAFQDAIKYLVKKYNLDVKLAFAETKYSESEQQLLDVFSDVCAFFNYSLNQEKLKNPSLSKFIDKRKLNSNLISQFKLGFASAKKNSKYKNFLIKKGHQMSTLINASLVNEEGDAILFNRFIFPIKNENNLIVALSSRKIDELETSAKYINSQESLIFKKNQIIYNFDKAKKYDEIIICEGFMDVIAFASIGIENAVALMGLSLSWKHISILKNKKIIFFLDGDDAGQSAQFTMIEKVLSFNLDASIVVNNENKDPDEIINTDGIEKIKSLLESKIPIALYYYKMLAKNNNMKDQIKAKLVIAKIFPLFKKATSELKKQLLINIANDLEISTTELENKYFLAKNLELNVKPKLALNTISKLNEDFLDHNQSIKNEDLLNDLLLYSSRMLAAMYKDKNILNYAAKNNPIIINNKVGELFYYLIEKNKNSNFHIENEEQLIKILDANLKKCSSEILPLTKEAFIENIKKIKIYDVPANRSFFLEKQLSAKLTPKQLAMALESEIKNRKK